MAVTFKRDRLLGEATSMLREIKAIRVFTGYRPTTAAHLAAYFASIERATTRELSGLVTDIRKKRDELRKFLGVRLSQAHLLKMLTFLEEDSSGKVALISRYFYDYMLGHPERISDEFVHWPLHSRIEVSLVPNATIEFYLLEAQFFESMAALFNLTKRTCPTRKNLKSKAERKLAPALYRATVSAAV